MKRERQEIYLLREKNRKAKYKKDTIHETLLVLFLFYADIWAFQDIMYSGGCLAAALAMGTLVVLIRQVCARSKKMSDISGVVIYIASLAGLVLSVSAVIPGFLDAVNRLGILWNLRFGTEFGRFTVTGNVAFGSLVLWGLLAVPVSSLLLMQVKKRKLGILMVTGAVCLFFGFVVGRSQMWGELLFLTASVLDTMIFLAAPKRWIGLGSVLYAAGAVLFFVLIFTVTAGYEGTPGLAAWRKDIQDRFEEFRYGSDTLPQGNLKKAGELLNGDDEETLIKVEMEKPQELYLKGFVGGIYNEGRWETLPPENYEGDYEGMLEWLGSEDFSVITQYADYDRLTAEDKEVKPEYSKVTVENVDAYRKYIYLPEVVESWSDARFEVKRDWQVQADGFFGEEKYSFLLPDDAPTAAEVTMAAWLQEPGKGERKKYLEAESVYHAFAEDYYLDVDENTKEWLREMFFPEDTQMGFSEVIAQVRKILRRQAFYTESAPEIPEDREFVQWFLEDAKEGNAVYFASAAVLAFRTAGYPARYVEGYHYPEEDAEKLEEDGLNTAELSCGYAHAWAEVYVSGIGWLPVEVVPGMYTETYTSQIVEGQPSYQVNSHEDDEGAQIESTSAGFKEEQGKEEKPHIPALSPREFWNYLVFVLYVIFLFYLLLEAQRAVRIAIRRRKDKDYIGELKYLLRLGRVTGEYNRPVELSQEIVEKVPGIRPEEYERVITLLQKMRFGDKQLLEYEIYTLECFDAKMKVCLYRKKGPFGRLMLRYRYALETAFLKTF